MAFFAGVRDISYYQTGGRGWQAERVAPYQPLTSRRGSPVPLDIIEDARRRQLNNGTTIDTTTLYSKLTGSKKQKPVQMQQTSDRPVPLPPPMAELKKQLAYSNMRLRACRAGADVASDMQVWS